MTTHTTKAWSQSYTRSTLLGLGQGENPVFRITKKYVPLNR